MERMRIYPGRSRTMKNSPHYDGLKSGVLFFILIFCVSFMFQGDYLSRLFDALKSNVLVGVALLNNLF